MSLTFSLLVVGFGFRGSCNRRLVLSLLFRVKIKSCWILLMSTSEDECNVSCKRHYVRHGANTSGTGGGNLLSRLMKSSDQCACYNWGSLFYHTSWYWYNWGQDGVGLQRLALTLKSRSQSTVRKGNISNWKVEGSNSRLRRIGSQ